MSGTKSSKKNRDARRTRLNKRLTTYSAMATGAVSAAVGTSAHAAPVVTDIPDFTITTGGALRFDLISGTTSYGVGQRASLPHTNDGEFVLVAGTSLFPGIYGPQGTNNAAFVTSGTAVGYRAALPLSASNTISTGLGFGANNIITLGNAAILIGNWSDNQRGFIGLRFEIAGAAHFGWAEITRGVSVGGQAPVTLHAFGYNDEPNAPIHIDPNPQIDTGIPEPATFGLGMLAMGAVGVSALKRCREAEAAA